MPIFGEAVESFLDVVIDNWDKVYDKSRFDQCCNALYELYHTETQPVTPVKDDLQFATCMENLVKLHKASSGTVKLRQHGYTEFHTNRSLFADADFEGDPYRVYVNASTKNVIVLGRILVKLACLDNRAAYFKIADDARGVDERKDAIVIYVFGKERAEKIAKELAIITGGSLTPTSPGLTKEIAPGISIACDPSSFSAAVSFGQHRVRPFATAILFYRDNLAVGGALDGISEAGRTKVFRILLAGAFRAHGINALDPSGNARAATPSISKSADNVASAVTIPRPEQMAARLILRSKAAQV